MFFFRAWLHLSKEIRHTPSYEKPEKNGDNITRMHKLHILHIYTYYLFAIFSWWEFKASAEPLWAADVVVLKPEI